MDTSFYVTTASFHGLAPNIFLKIIQLYKDTSMITRTLFLVPAVSVITGLTVLVVFLETFIVLKSLLWYWNKYMGRDQKLAEGGRFRKVRVTVVG